MCVKCYGTQQCQISRFYDFSFRKYTHFYVGGLIFGLCCTVLATNIVTNIRANPNINARVNIWVQNTVRWGEVIVISNINKNACAAELENSKQSFKRGPKLI